MVSSTCALCYSCSFLLLVPTNCALFLLFAPRALSYSCSVAALCYLYSLLLGHSATHDLYSFCSLLLVLSAARALCSPGHLCLEPLPCEVAVVGRLQAAVIRDILAQSVPEVKLE